MRGRRARGGRAGGGRRAARPARAAALLAAALLAARAAAPPALTATISAPGDAGAAPGASTVVALTVDDASGILGTDLLLIYDPAVATATSVSRTSLTSAHTLTYNLSPPGVVRISLYGSAPLSGSGPLVDIAFSSAGPPGSRTSLDLASGDLNEGAVALSVSDGAYCVAGPPSEATNLRAAHVSGSTAALLSWAPHPWAATYNVYRGTRADLADLSCLLAGVSGTSAQDGGDVPAPRTMFVFLVTAVACSGESGLGTRSSGAARMNPAPCP